MNYPARDKKCFKCNNIGHFIICCRNMQSFRQDKRSHVHNLAEKKADNERKHEEWLNNIETREKTREDKCRMFVNGRPVMFQIDTGSTVNLLPRKFADDIRLYNGKIIMWNRNETGTINEQTTTTLENSRTH